jgi:5-methylcytosine-specific restriction endonuclease McrA
MRDMTICQKCGQFTLWAPRYPGDPEAFDMAHIISRGAGGSDTLDNVRTLCHRDHMNEHAKGKTA